MGAGQIGGIATLLDIDFENAAGFLGRNAVATEGQFMVYYFSQALMFCVGALIEPHIVLTPAMCVIGERYMFEVFGGTHTFLENSGVSRKVQHLALHRGYNHSKRWLDCITDNMAILVLNEQFSFNKREYGSEFVVNRVRYGVINDDKAKHPGRQGSKGDKPLTCGYYGWGSRRNGYLIPLLIQMRHMEAKLLSKDVCPSMWNKDDKYLCLEHPPCKSEDFGALCPDDVGSVLICAGYVKGMMISRLVDRPCGVGFLDMSLYNKFLTCAVDDSRDVIMKDFMSVEFTTMGPPPTPSIVVPHYIKEKTEDDEKAKDDEEGDNNDEGAKDEKDEKDEKDDKDDIEKDGKLLQDQLRELKGLLDEAKSFPRKRAKGRYY